MEEESSLALNVVCTAGAYLLPPSKISCFAASPPSPNHHRPRKHPHSPQHICSHCSGIVGTLQGARPASMAAPARLRASLLRKGVHVLSAKARRKASRTALLKRLFARRQHQRKSTKVSTVQQTISLSTHALMKAKDLRHRAQQLVRHWEQQGWQPACPLLSLLPAEIRDKINSFALLSRPIRHTETGPATSTQSLPSAAQRGWPDLVHADHLQRPHHQLRCPLLVEMGRSRHRHREIIPA